mmetsp:Transcript_8544/g.31569  ORF Transcript_8544/g.31569 Transcript_8544/m.31569 type:complete len:355 (-) Transcript_8544:172-1236(-)
MALYASQAQPPAASAPLLRKSVTRVVGGGTSHGGSPRRGMRVAQPHLLKGGLWRAQQGRSLCYRRNRLTVLGLEGEFGERRSKSNPMNRRWRTDEQTLNQNFRDQIHGDLIGAPKRRPPADDDLDIGRVRGESGPPVLSLMVFTVVGVCIGSWGIVNSSTDRFRPRSAAVVMADGSLQDPTSPEYILGHRRVHEAPVHELMPVSSDHREKLRKPAAESFLRMQHAASRDGVSLVPLSTFRSVSEQEDVFFALKAQRKQAAYERARVSAPPGYSEHHTGYAVDIGDGLFAETHLEETFEHTRAYHWLKKHAHIYHYEMSFPRNNPGGVDYEPWHWRWVGDRQSMATFYGNTRTTQ